VSDQGRKDGPPDIAAWVKGVTRKLVDRPDEVTVETVREEDADVFEVRVAQEEMGRVIGRQGRTVQAMRALLDAAAEKHGAAYELEILDEE
jgi:predicted RNA-binding protein YlqC (UPF0109 family)